DPAALLSTVVLPDGSQNYDSFNDPKITSALEQARSTADPAKRAALVAQAEKLTIQQMPGIPVAALSGGRSLPASSIAMLEQRYHLNQSFLAQYWYWLDNALHGNLGISITLRENVSTLLASRVWTTAGLVLYASLIIAALGIGIGIVAGLRPGVLDTGTLVTTAVSAAIPAFVAAIVLILLFAVKLRWFPALGNGTDLASNIRHFTLPAIALAISSLAIVARVTRASIREEGEREHVQTAVSRGIPAR